ncbi:hypothetical protein H072_5634 [Dactylellina haptotyla CBS 200.50]|uniref:Uncharacterized protein n=1 Tax=Dactylellina haptotyla (strain CBS 200.50) TaxID=1284197 RepID=S8AC52_DACHA|nr:hypothetical protein H072_5634 [Dactylellina haptotyla CBS 200.50]
MLMKISTLVVAITTVVSATNTPTNFYLVTSSQSVPCSNSANLADASAISTFDPYYQENFLLRKIGPGYGSLPTFNLKRGNLETIASLPHGGPLATYTTLRPKVNTELMFNPAPTTARGPLTIRDGLVGYHGINDRWYNCPGDFGEQVIVYQAKKPDCTKVYLHTASLPPY